MSTTTTTFWVLTEGETEEEQYSWESIEANCREGKFTPETRIFFPTKNKWVRAGDTELKSLFKRAEPAGEGVNAAAQAEEAAEESSLEADYRETIQRIGAEPESVEAHLEAGRLAAHLGDRKAAAGHFQNALTLKPFNARVANEVMRRFSKSECRQFQYLRRDPPVWDDPAELLNYPFAGGVLFLAIPAAVLFILSFIPSGGYVAGALAFLWAVHIARRTADGSIDPPTGIAALRNPVREIILPLFAGALVAGLCALVVYGVGRASMALDGSRGSAFRHVADSPVLTVTLTLAGLFYLPAVFSKLVHSVGMVVHLLNPVSVLQSMNQIGQEYAVSALTVLVVAAVLGGIRLVLGGIPIVGELVFAVAAALAIPIVGLVLGRLTGRMRHVL
ncbi:MAG: hypothetical protein PVF33_09330 [Candidatus Latescibacterota bacterium]|jgi:hypothetical protein